MTNNEYEELLKVARDVVAWADDLRMYSEQGTVLVPALQRLKDVVENINRSKVIEQI